MEILALSDEISEGTELTVKKEEPSLDRGAVGVSIRVSAGGSVLFKNNKPCILCAEVIKIAPDTTIEINSSEAIMAGSIGVTLKRIKGSKKIMFIEGNAYLIRK